MGLKHTVYVHLGFWLYLLIGGAIYYVIENPVHRVPVPKTIAINISFCHILLNSVDSYVGNGYIGHSQHNDTNMFGKWLSALNESCHNLTTSLTDDDPEDPAWEYSSALFFVMTMLTTIGYGNFSPKTDGGKIFCLFFGFVGIPICGLFLAATSNYFSNNFLRLYERKRKLQNEKWHQVMVAAFVFLLPGLAVFLFIPAAIFVAIEDWDYLDSIYFSFISLTTIGFGDVVAAQQTNLNLLWFYRVCLIIWVTLGIAYWAIIIAFVTKALKSKELRERWEKTSKAISHQAKELKRHMSTSTLHVHETDAFIALKSKSAFDFAFHLTGSIGNLGQELEHQQLPGIATALKPQGPGRGVLALMELPFLLGKHAIAESTSQPIPSASPSEDKVDTCPHRGITPRPKLSETFKSVSADSGLGEDTVQRDVPKSTDSSVEKVVRHWAALKKMTSRSSLPTDLVEENEESRGKNLWKSLFRSTRPELHRHSSEEGTNATSCEPNPTRFRELLVEAMMILDEAEARGSTLCLNQGDRA